MEKTKKKLNDVETKRRQKYFIEKLEWKEHIIDTYIMLFKDIPVIVDVLKFNKPYLLTLTENNLLKIIFKILHDHITYIRLIRTKLPF